MFLVYPRINNPSMVRSTDGLICSCRKIPISLNSPNCLLFCIFPPFQFILNWIFYLDFLCVADNGNRIRENVKTVAMTSLILENADLNRLFPKCRPRSGNPPQLGATDTLHQLNQHQPHERRTDIQKQESATYTCTLSSSASSSASIVTGTGGFPVDDMIDLEHDTTDR